jgi:hypothetical protein
MPGKSQSHTDAVLNVLRGTDLTGVAPYVGLFSVAPADDNSAGTELAGSGYTKTTVDAKGRVTAGAQLAAGVWSGSSTSSIEAYSKSLTDARKAIGAINSHDKAHQAWDECFGKILDNLTSDASNYVNSLSAPSRERVAVYRSPLWIWHRLDVDRWATSQIQLRVGKSKPAVEVDHTVAFSLWRSKLATQEAQGSLDEAEALALVNRLGNCALLEKNFNISKSDKGLKHFLSQIHEVLQQKIRVDAWCAALSISQPILDPASATISDVTEAIENRDKEIRAELVEFVRGQRVRVDVITPLATSGAYVPSLTPHQPIISTVVPSSAQPPEPVDGDGDVQRESHQTTEAGSGTDIGGVCAAYAEDPDVRLIIDHFAGRQRNQNTTEIEALLDALARAGTPSEKPALIHAFRRLDALGIGRFVAGRRGHATRFEWREKSLTVRDLAINQGDQQLR